MKRQILLFSFGILCFISPPLLNASVCSNLIKSIHRDVAQYSSGDTMPAKHLAWMNIYWLKKRLGAAAISKNLDHTTDDPDKEQLQYTWRCRENEDTRLIAVANRKGLITYIEGQYSSMDGADMFAVILPQNRFVPPIPAPKPAVVTPPATQTASPQVIPPLAPAPETTPAPTTDSLAELLNPYNEHFHSAMRSKEELVNDMIDKMKLFYKNLRACSPGIYRYSIYLQSGFIFPVSTIEGENKGLCQVDTLFTVPNLGEVNAKCLYSQKDLGVYTDEEAEALVKGKSFDKNNPSPRDKAEAEACNTYVNGKLQPKLVK